MQIKNVIIQYNIIKMQIHLLLLHILLTIYLCLSFFSFFIDAQPFFILFDELFIIQQALMQCLFEGIQGVGSIYTTSSSQFTYDDLKKSKCGALVIISSQNKKTECYKIRKVLSLIVKEQDDETYFNNFPKLSNFIGDAKKQTNILIYSTHGEHMSIIFFFAYLIDKYHYTLEQIENIYQRKLKKIKMNQKDFIQLKGYLNGEKLQSMKLKTQAKEDQTTIIDKRMKRINIYSELTKKSDIVYEQIKKQSQKNPEKKLLFDELYRESQEKSSNLKKMKKSDEITLKRKKSLSLYKKSESTNIS